MINKFDGQYRFLSNFVSSNVYLDGEQYSTIEHAYQAAKTLDQNRRLHIREARTPGIAKAEGRKVPLRPDWEAVKLNVMRDLIAQKFAFRTPLAANLLATGDEVLVEGNTWGDTFWGVCGGVGKNWLGALLMERRAVLRGT